MGADYEVAVIGAGFGGIGMATRLAAMGVDNFVILEKSDRLGGTWRDNTYPGAACDVPSHLYSFSWDQPAWRRRYSPQADILAYLEGVVRSRGLRPHLQLGSAVDEVAWNDDAARWELTVSGTPPGPGGAGGGARRRLSARVVVAAVGQLNRPSWPDVPGRETFAGPSWHSARWDHGVDLRDRTVAAVGTGASAIQYVPEVAKVAERLCVFQRSAPYVLPKKDGEYEGASRWLYSLHPGLRRADRLRIFVYGELLTSGYLNPARAGLVTKRWRKFLDQSVEAPELKAKCLPDYQVGCKRIGFSNDWYKALGRSNVELVTEPIEEIRPEGVVTSGGVVRRADVLIWGTGFKSTEFLAPMKVTGRGGRDLHAEWRAGAEAFLGVAVANFPNFFVLYGPNTNLGANSIIYMLESQIEYVAQAIEALRGDLAWLEVRGEVQGEFARWVDAAGRPTTYRSGCRSWYTTESGRNTNNWPDFTFRYRRRLAHLDLLDYQVQPAPSDEVPA